MLERKISVAIFPSTIFLSEEWRYWIYEIALLKVRSLNRGFSKSIPLPQSGN
jgi:hypothetical protein